MVPKTEKEDSLLYRDESYLIRGACFAVYKKLGGDFKESMIQKALALELKGRELEIEEQKRIEIHYRGEKIGTYVPDFVVAGKILIELKAKPLIVMEDQKQFWRYLKATEYRLGFLINFGTTKLEIHRRVYDRARNPSA